MGGDVEMRNAAEASKSGAGVSSGQGGKRGSGRGRGQAREGDEVHYRCAEASEAELLVIFPCDVDACAQNGVLGILNMILSQSAPLSWTLPEQAYAGAEHVVPFFQGR